MSNTPDREGFVEKWGPNEWPLSGRQEFISNLDALFADEFVAGVEWGIKSVSSRVKWPVSWDAGFPGMKAQALIDRATAIRNGKGGGG